MSLARVSRFDSFIKIITRHEFSHLIITAASKFKKIKSGWEYARYIERNMNQSINTTNFDGNKLANYIWAMFGAPQGNETKSSAGQPQKAAGSEDNLMNDAPDLATEILSRLEQKKETAAAHLGISAAEVETMPFDLSALEQAGIFLNIDATGFSVLSRQLDWQSLGIELPKEQTVHLIPPRTGLLPDNYRKPLQRAASQAHNALDRYSFRFALCETVLGSSEYRWIPYTAFEAFEKEFAAALETLARAKTAVIENYPEILETLWTTFRQLATDSAERLTATVKDEPFDLDEFINRTVERAMGMIPNVKAIRDGMRIEMRPKVILLGSEMRAEQVKSFYFMNFSLQFSKFCFYVKFIQIPKPDFTALS